MYIVLLFIVDRGWSQTVIDTVSSQQHAIPPTISFGFDYYSPSLMDESVAPGAEDLKLQVSEWNLGIVVPDWINDRNTITHEFKYSQLNIDYLDLSVDLGILVTTTHKVEYAFTWEKTLSKKWNLLTIVNPGLASEFKSDLSVNDLILTMACIGIRKYTERLSIGYGVGFSPDFGTHFPLPVFAMRWNNGKNMKIEAILPVNFSFAYRPNSVFDLGFDFSVNGSRYHGAPLSYGVDNPQMRYSVTKGGPSITFNLFPWLHLKCKGGYTLFRRIEFYDGLDEVESFDIKQSGFLSLQLVVGE